MTLCMKCAKNAGNCDYLCSNKAVKGWKVKCVYINRNTNHQFGVRVISCPNYIAISRDVSGLKRLEFIRG